MTDMTAILRELDAAWHAGDCTGAVALAASYWRSLAPRDADRVARYLLEKGAPPTTRSHGEGAVRLSVEIRLGLRPAGHPARLGLVGPLVESLAAWDDLPGAAEAARTALDQDGERASAAARAGLLTQLGRLYAARSDTTAAREWLVRALAEPLDDRHHGYTLATLQQLEADVGRPREADRVAWRRLRASDSLRRAPTPADGQLLADLACLLRDAGEPAEAGSRTVPDDPFGEMPPPEEPLRHLLPSLSRLANPIAPRNQPKQRLSDPLPATNLIQRIIGGSSFGGPFTRTTLLHRIFAKTTPTMFFPIS